jgi:hypothetical protein
MWWFRPLPLSGRVPPRVCLPPLDFAGRRADQQATSCFGCLPHPIEPWRRGEGELYVSLASYFDRNSPSWLLISPPLQLPLQISSPGAEIAPQLLAPIDIDGIDLKRRRKGEFLVCFALDITRNSPIIFGLHDVPPAGDNQGRWGLKAPLDGLLVCSSHLNTFEVEEQRYVLLCCCIIHLIVTNN